MSHPSNNEVQLGRVCNFSQYALDFLVALRCSNNKVKGFFHGVNAM